MTTWEIVRELLAATIGSCIGSSVAIWLMLGLLTLAQRVERK